MTAKSPARSGPSPSDKASPGAPAFAILDEATADTQIAPARDPSPARPSPRVDVVAPIDREAATLDAPAAPPPTSSRHGLSLSLTDVDRYDVSGEIARGGLGRILKATDKRLRRPVALKELLAPGPGSEARFLREAHITARLQHPSIIPLYDAGHSKSGDLFYSMKLVFGSSLEEAIFAKKTLADRLALLPHVIDVAEAIAYAHSKRIIHRDLKPQNVLVGEFGETVVIDWGIAKDLAQGGADSGDLTAVTSALHAAGSADLTIDGAIMGTPAYMPPEQARGEAVDERADVYALGAILYHLLAGVPPYDDPELREILRKLLATPPIPPVPIDLRLRGVPRDLCAIVNKAIASAPADRYPSARELAADLKKFQTGQIVGAYSYTRAELVARWLRRNKLVTLLVALIVAGGAVSVVSILDRTRAAEEGRSVAVAARAKAEAAEERERKRADEVTLEQARLSLEHDPQRSLDFLAQLSPSFPRMSAARVIAADALSRTLPLTLRGHTGGVFWIAFSPDSERLVSGSYDKTVRLWDLHTGAQRVLEGHAAEVSCVAFSPDGAQVASASYDKTIRLWDVKTGASRVLEGHTDWLSSIAFSADGKTLVSSGADETIRVWDLSGEKTTSRILPGSPGRVTAIDLSADGRRLVSLHADGALLLWDLEKGTNELLDRSIDKSGGTVRFSPAGDLVASSEQARGVLLWDIRRRKARWLVGHEDLVTDMAFSPDGKRLASASIDRAVRLWDVEKGELLRVLRGHEGAVTFVVFSPDGRRVASASEDRTVRLWDGESGDSLVFRAHSGRISRIAFSPDGRRLASSATDGTVRVWSPAEGRGIIDERSAASQQIVPLGEGRVAVSRWDPSPRVCDIESRQCETLSGHTDVAFHIAVSGDKKLLVSASNDSTLRVWDVSARPARFVRALEGHAGPASDVAFVPDASHVVSGGADRTVRVWDLATGQSRVLSGHTDAVTRVLVSPDGARAVSVSRDKTLRLWDLATFEPRILAGHESFILDVAFSPDGQTVASASLDRTVRLWSTKTGEPRVLTGAEGGMFSVAFSPDGRSLLSGSDGGVVRLWDLATGTSRAFPAGGSSVYSVAFSPDGLTAAAAVRDSTIHLWDIATGEGRTLRGHVDAVRRVTFLPDGERLCSTSDDGTLRLWRDDLPHDEAAVRARIKALATPAPTSP